MLNVKDYPLLWRVSTSELKIIALSLTELSKTWQTAKGTLGVLRRLQETVSAFRQSTCPAQLRCDEVDWALFKPFGLDFCSRMRIVIDNAVSNPTFREHPETERATGAGDAALSANTHMAVLSANDEFQWDSQQHVAENTSPQSLMANLLQDLSSESLFNGEDWFLQNI